MTARLVTEKPLQQNPKIEKLMDSAFVVRTLVVEDNSFWQEIIVRKLQEQSNLQVIAIVADGLQAVHNA